MIDLDKNITRLVSVSFFGGIFGRLFQFGVYLAIARGLGPEALGVFSFGLVVLNVGTLVSMAGLDKAARKFVPLHDRRGEQDKLNGVLIVCLGGAFAFGTIVSLLVYQNVGLIESATVSRFGGATTVFLVGIPFMAVMSVGAAATTGFLTTRHAVYIKDLAQSGGAVLLVVLAIVSGTSVDGAILGYVASIGFASALAIWLVIREGGIRWRAGVEIDLRGTLGYSLPLVFAALAQYVAEWTDILVLGMFEPASVIGTYQVGYQVASMLGFTLFAVNSIFPSLAAGLYDSGNLERLRDVYAAITKWVTYLTVLGYGWAVVYAKPILSVFGAEFAAAEVPLIIIGGVFVVTAGVGPAGFLLMMSNYERVEVLNTLVAASLNVVLNVVLIQRFGMVGAAVATGLSMSVLNLGRLVETWRFMRVAPRVGTYWKGGIAVAVAVAAMLVTKGLVEPDVPVVVVSGAISLGVFSGVLYALGVDEEDRLLVESIP